MKSPKILTGLLAVAFASPVFGATFEITGATAFRAATITSIHALYKASGVAFRFSHNRATEADFINADVVTFDGTITGLGPTVIRCSFNGSIEGLRALAQPGQTGIEGSNGDASYLKLSTAQTEAASTGEGTNIQNVANSGANIERALAEMAFSDTDKAISPYAADDMEGASPGVNVFGLLVSEVASGQSTIANVTAQQYNSLLTNGVVRMSQLTGLSSDSNRLVFCTGRNDGSGTRSSYLAEMGYGVANPVNQFLVVSSTSTNITAIQNVPAGGVNDSNPGLAGIQLPPGSAIQLWQAAGNTVTQNTTSASTVWGQDVNGNGGAFSGSALRGDMGRIGASVRVFSATGSDLYGNVPQNNITLVTWITLNDAITARAAGATIAAFDGVSLSLNGGAGLNELTATDKNKIYNGQYTAWNFQQLYRRATADADTVTLYDAIFGAIPNNLATAGLKNSDMKVGRAGDGGVINPIF